MAGIIRARREWYNMDSEGEMIPKGGFGQEGGSPFGLFRKAAELLEKTGRARPRIAKHAEKREELYTEEVAPGIYVKVSGLTQSGKLVEGDRRYEFDVFDVCEVSDDKLIFASDEQGSVQETTEGMGKRLASSFGNELYPLIMDAMIYQGVDTLDRMSAIDHLRNIGESRWADYLMDEIDDGQWTDIVSDLINSTSDDFTNTAAYQGTGQWLKGENGEEEEDEEEEKEEKVASQDFAQGYEYGSGADARELSAREIAEMWPEVNPDEFAQGMLDGLSGDTFRTDQQTGQSDLLKDAAVEWEEEKSYQLGYEYGSAPGAERMDTAQISEYLSSDKLDVKPDAKGLFNMVGSVSAFQKGMNDALSGQSKKIDEMTGQGDMFRGGKKAQRVDEDARLGEAGNRILSAFRDGSDMQVTERNPYGHEGFPSFVPRKSLYDLLILWSPEQIDADIEKGVELGYWDATRSGLKYKGGSKLADLDTWGGEDKTSPTSEDIVMYPSGSLGGKTSVSEVEGKFLGEFNTDDEAEAFIKQYMQQQNWYPDVWFQDDHGGYTLRTLASKWAGNEKDIWMMGRIQNLLASGEAQNYAQAQQIAAQQWDEQSQFAEEFERQQGGPMGYRDTGRGYNAPMQIDPSAESHIGSRKIALAQKIRAMMGSHVIEFAEQTEDQWQVTETSNGQEPDASSRLYTPGAMFYSWDVWNQCDDLRAEGWTIEPPGWEQIVSNDEPVGKQANGYEEIPLDKWEEMMPEMDISNEEIAQDFAEYQKVNGGGGDVGQELKGFIRTNYPQQLAEFNAILGIYNQLAGNQTVGFRQKADVDPSVPYDESGPRGGRQSTHVRYTEFGYTDEDDIPEAWLMGSASKGTTIQEETRYWFHQKWMEDGTAQRLIQEGKARVAADGISLEMVTAFKVLGMEDDEGRKQILRDAFQTGDQRFSPTPGYDKSIVEHTGCSPDEVGYVEWLIVREASGETNEQIAGAWHEFMISDRGQMIGSPLAGLKLFIQYNYPDKLNEYEQISEIYSNTQWPSSSVEGYPEALYPAD